MTDTNYTLPSWYAAQPDLELSFGPTKSNPRWCLITRRGSPRSHTTVAIGDWRAPSPELSEYLQLTLGTVGRRVSVPNRNLDQVVQVIYDFHRLCEAPCTFEDACSLLVGFVLDRWEQP